MPYLALSFDLGVMDVEVVEEHCFATGALSVTLGDAADDAVLEPAPGEIRLWPATRVQAMYAADQASALLVQQLAAQLGLAATAIDVHHVADRAWEREWLRDFHAMRFGQQLWICPHHESVDDPAARVVRLDPGLAFGTGTHASTALCLTWLDANLRDQREIIDYGCGSGILALAAARLGARRVQAFDIDPQALLACEQNAVVNSLGERIAVRSRSTDLQAGADLLLANILAGTLMDLVPGFAALVRPAGQIVLAGILFDQQAAVTAAYAPWFDIVPVSRREDWVLLAGKRR